MSSSIESQLARNSNTVWAYRSYPHGSPTQFYTVLWKSGLPQSLPRFLEDETPIVYVPLKETPEEHTPPLHVEGWNLDQLERIEAEIGCRAATLFRCHSNLCAIKPEFRDSKWIVVFCVPCKMWIPWGEDALPRRIAGFSTRVVGGWFHSCTRLHPGDVLNPVPPGCAIVPEPLGFGLIFGTLGGLIIVNDKAYGVTVGHLFRTEDNSCILYGRGTQICQPGACLPLFRKLQAHTPDDPFRMYDQLKQLYAPPEAWEKMMDAAECSADDINSGVRVVVRLVAAAVHPIDELKLRNMNSADIAIVEFNEDIDVTEHVLKTGFMYAEGEVRLVLHVSDVNPFETEETWRQRTVHGQGARSGHISGVISPEKAWIREFQPPRTADEVVDHENPYYVCFCVRSSPGYSFLQPGDSGAWFWYRDAETDPAVLGMGIGYLAIDGRAFSMILPTSAIICAVQHLLKEGKLSSL